MSEDVTGEKSAPWHSKRWLVIVAILFTVVSMVVVGISVAAHLAWQASPEKALVDAFEFSSKTPAMYKVAAKDVDATISYDGTRHAISGTHKSVRFNAVIDGTMLYVKSDTPAELVKLFTPAGVPENLRPMIDTVTTQITDKWVVLSLEKLPLANASESRSVSCAMSVKSQLTTDKEAKREILKVYEDSRFLVAKKTETNDKSDAYRLTIDDAKFEDFTTALKNSVLYKSQKTECEGLVRSLIDAKGKNNDLVADIMLSKSKNALQKAVFKDATNGTTTVDVKYGDVGTITIPSDPVTYESISSSIVQSMIRSYLNK